MEKQSSSKQSRNTVEMFLMKYINPSHRGPLSPPPPLKMSSWIAKMVFTYLVVSGLVCHVARAQNGELTINDNDDTSPTSPLQHYPGGENKFRTDLVTLIGDNYNLNKFNRNTMLQRLFGDKFLHIFASALNEKNKRDDDIPPGFIGVRGRRSRREFEDIIRSLLNNVGHSNMIVSPSQPEFQIKSQLNKKSDSIAYKDGFLGVRG